MKFVLALIGLVLVGVVIGGGILFLIAKLQGKDPWRYLSGRNSENRWAKVFGIELVIIGIIAGATWSGPAVLLPDAEKTTEKVQNVKGFFRNIWTDIPPVATDKIEPLPWGQGTRFWRKAFLILFPLWVVFVCYAYSDDIIRFAETRREEKEKHAASEPNKGKKTEEGLIRPPSVWDIFSLLEMLARFFGDRRKK